MFSSTVKTSHSALQCGKTMVACAHRRGDSFFTMSGERGDMQKFLLSASCEAILGHSKAPSLFRQNGQSRAKRLFNKVMRVQDDGASSASWRYRSWLHDWRAALHSPCSSADTAS